MEYDFIEIGTSDFRTLIQGAAEDTVGISVEPVRLYMDRLPSPSKVLKLNLAVATQSGWTEVHYLHPDTIRSLRLPWWLRGCGSVGKPHLRVTQVLAERGIDYDTAVRRETVRVVTLKELFDAQ